MDVKYINPFLKGTLDVLKTMAFVDAVAGRAFLKKTEAATGDVSAIIGITGDVVGSLAISFSESCICSIVGSMLGEEFPEANREVFDAAGEITNMVSGKARSYMEKEGLTVFAAIPTVVFGKGHSVQHILKAPSIVVPFSTAGGEFAIDVCIKTVEEKAKKDQIYRVLNVKTADMVAGPAMTGQPPATPGGKEAPPLGSEAGGEKKEQAAEALSDEEKMERLNERLAEAVSKRNDILKELNSKPFMPIDRRNKLKKELPVYEGRIKRLKLDIRALEMISKISKDQLDDPKLPAHFQHYQR